MQSTILIIFISLFIIPAYAYENTNTEHAINNFQECVAVSLYTLEGRELNSIIKNNRHIVKTSLIPDNWSLVGVTEISEDDGSRPYMVICQ